MRALGTALAVAAGDEELMLRFLWDLLSAREILNAANRWAAARMLLAGETQASTSRALGLSPKTIIEVNRWARGMLTADGFGEVQRRLAAGAPGGQERGPPVRRERRGGGQARRSAPITS